MRRKEKAVVKAGGASRSALALGEALLGGTAPNNAVLLLDCMLSSNEVRRVPRHLLPSLSSALRRRRRREPPSTSSSSSSSTSCAASPSSPLARGGTLRRRRRRRLSSTPGARPTLGGCSRRGCSPLSRLLQQYSAFTRRLSALTCREDATGA